MKTIPLTRGLVALVDDADYASVSQFKWFALKARNGFYAVRNLRKPDGKWTQQYMHRFLMPGVAEVHHIDGNGLNNQRESNLCPTTHQQNMRGFQRKRVGATSKYRGVCWNKEVEKWQADIWVDSKTLTVGYFEDEIDAARTRDAAAIKYFGPSAQTNFPLTPTQIQTILNHE